MSAGDKRRRRRGWWFLICLIGVPLLLLICGLLFNLANYYGYHKRLAAIRAQGLPGDIEDLNKWNAPDADRNGIEHNKTAAEKLEQADADFETLIATIPEWKNNDDYMFQNPDYEYGLDKELLDNMLYPEFFMRKHADFYKKLLALYQPALDEMMLALDFDGIHDVVTPELSAEYLMSCRSFALWLRTKASYDLVVLKDSKACLADIDACFVLGQKLQVNNILISQLVAVACGGIGASSFNRCINYGGFTPQQLRTFADNCAQYKVAPLPLWKDCMIGERAFTQQLVDKKWLQTGKLYDNPFMENLFFVNQSLNKFYAVIYGNIFFYYDMNTQFDDYTSLIDAADISGAEVRKRADEIERRSFSGRHLKRYILPFSSDGAIAPLTGGWKTFRKFNNQLAMCAVGARLQADRLEGRLLPKDLSGYPERDVFTGKPFLLRTKGDYIYIVSPGEDLKEAGTFGGAHIGSFYIYGEMDDMVFMLRRSLDKPKPTPAENK